MDANAEFKAVCAIWQLDTSCYGWQKRHDRGKKWQRSGNEMARWVVKTAMFWDIAGRSYPCRGWCKRVRWAWLARYAVVKVLAAHGGVAVIERKYRKEGRMSSGRNIHCRTPGYFPLRCGDQHSTGCGSRAIRVEMVWIRASGVGMPAPLTDSHSDQMRYHSSGCISSDCRSARRGHRRMASPSVPSSSASASR